MRRTASSRRCSATRRRNSHLREIDLNDRFFQVLDVDVSTTADFEALDLQALVVDLQYGGTPDNPSVAGSAEFTPAKKDPDHFQAFFQEENYSYRYKLNYKFGQSENIAAQHHDYETPWQTTTSRALVAHPPDDIAMLHVFLDPGVVDWDVVSRIETRLIYEDPANQFNVERTFLVAQDSKRQEWIVRLTDPALRTYKVQNRWHLKDLSEIQGKVTEEKVSAPVCRRSIRRPAADHGFPAGGGEQRGAHQRRAVLRGSSK